MKQTLLLIDIQNDYFPGGAFPLPAMKRAAAKAAAILKHARKKKWNIIHIRHEEKDPESAFLLQGTKGTKINQLVKPKKGEVVITKHFPNSFRGSTLAKELKGTKKLIIVGAMSNMCIDATARAAFDRGFEVTVVEDACAACELSFKGRKIAATTVHGSFMESLAAAYGKVIAARECLGET